MSVTTSDVTIETVDAIYDGRQMTIDQAKTLRDMGVRFVNQVYGDSINMQNEIEGNETDFAVLIVAHLWAMKEREASSESDSGGSISYANAASGQYPIPSLSESRYGRMAQAFLRDAQSVGIEKTRSNFRF